MVVAHQGDQRRAGGGRVATGDQIARRLSRCPVKAKIRQAGGFPLAHRDAALQLRKVFPEADLQDQRLHLSEPARLFQTGGPGAHLAQRLDVGRKPGQGVGRELVGLKCRAADLPLDGHAIPQGTGGGGGKGLDLGQGLGGQGKKVGNNCGLAHQSNILRHRNRPFLHLQWVTAFAVAAQ